MENKWEMLESSNEDREKLWKKNRTFAGDVWFRFRHKPTAIAGFVIIILLLLFALAGPYFTKYSYSAQNLELVNIPPRMKVYEAPDGTGYMYITQSLKVVWVNKDGTLGGQLKKVREESESSMTIFDCNGTEVALYYGTKPYMMADPETRVLYPAAHVFNKSYTLGTDSLGRDILTRLMYGTRVSLMVAFVAACESGDRYYLRRHIGICGRHGGYGDDAYRGYHQHDPPDTLCHPDHGRARDRP